MRKRSVVEIMVLVFTGVVAFSIVGLSIMILVVEVKNPEADTALVANTLMTLVGGILGALLGLIAGKGAAGEGLAQTPLLPPPLPPVLPPTPCESCGRDVPHGATFCPSCGHVVKP